MKEQGKGERAAWWLALPASVLWMELVARGATLGLPSGRTLLYLTLFGGACGLVLSGLCSLLKKRSFTLCILSLGLLWVYLGVQMVYYEVFDTFATFSSAAGAGDAFQFWDIILASILSRLPWMLAAALPLAALALALHRGRWPLRPAPRTRWALLGAAAGLQLAGAVLTLVFAAGVPTDRQLYTDTFLPVATTRRFGFVTAARVNLREMLLPTRPQLPPLTLEASLPASVGPDSHQMLAIDFDSLLGRDRDNPQLRYLHSFFRREDPTPKNQYTGLFQGKNLIVITAESFSPLAIHPQWTPTLWRLQQEGVRFTNFYCPLWGISTIDGEYAHLTGLIPKINTWSLWQSADNQMPLVLGNQLRDRGYATYAYHNHQYDYYHRDQSHPNLGYTYLGQGGGLELTPQWPESDREMVEQTIDDYLGRQPFHIYYMTVSGHMAYNFRHNAMAARHQDWARQLPYPEEVQAYLACTRELDQALELLLRRLEEAGAAQDTVIALTADHYPYGLSAQSRALLKSQQAAGPQGDGGQTQPTPQDRLAQQPGSQELYRGAFLLWSGEMGPLAGQEVDKVCTTQDILPTLSNLMGLDYDSRLLVGKDILSPGEGLVIFADYSWLTSRGRYDSGTGCFTPDEKHPPQDQAAYLAAIHRRVAELYRVSAMVLDQDYYAVVLPQDR